MTTDPDEAMRRIARWLPYVEYWAEVDRRWREQVREGDVEKGDGKMAGAVPVEVTCGYRGCRRMWTIGVTVHAEAGLSARACQPMTCPRCLRANNITLTPFARHVES